MIKLSEEELFFITGTEDLELGTFKLADLGPSPVLVTLGDRGCLFNYKGKIERLEGHEVDAKDTTGAGDGFMAGFLHKLLEEAQDLSKIEPRNLFTALNFGNATGALTTTDYGATSAFPDSSEVKEFLKKT